MIETVLFDIDDTLVNHSGAEKQAIQNLRRSFFPLIEPDSFEAVWLERTKANWELFRKGRISFVQQRVQRMQDVWDSYGKTLDRREAEENFGQYLAAYEASWELFPDVSETISALRAHRIALGIISNGNYDQQTRKLQVTGIISYFQENLILVSEKVGISKPDPGIFIHAQKISGSKNRDILIIGDDLPLDIEPAITLGWNGVLIDRLGRYNSHTGLSYQRLTNLKDIFQNEFRKK